jgi:hypothetical protein
MRNETPKSPDPILVPFLQANEEAESQQHLERLIAEHAEPVIKGIIRAKLRVSLDRRGGSYQSRDDADAEDVHGEAVLQLLTRLRDFKTHPDEENISSFRGYVAVTTYHAYDKYLREKYPGRWRLKCQSRYLLENRTNQKGFAQWRSDGGDWLCGFAAWRDRPDIAQMERRAGARAGRLRQLLDDPPAFARAAIPQENVQRMNRADLLAAIFNWLGHPVELDDLITVIAELLGIRDESPITETSYVRNGEDDGSHVLE